MAVTNTVTGKMNYLTVGGNTYEIEDKNAAPLASPAFTGTPTAPTATAGTSTTQIATTEFVMDAMSGAGAGTVTSVGISNATNGGLSVSGSPITSSGTITVGHSNILTSAQTTQAVYPIKIDKNGHISAYGSAVTIPSKTSDLTNDSGFITSDSDEKLALAEITSTVQYYPIIGTGTTASTRQYDTTGFIYIGTNGTTTTVGTANLTLGNATASGTVNNKRGQIYLYGASTGRTRINTNVTSGTSTVSFPDKGGTVALTDDIPTVPTITLNGSSTTSPSFYAPASVGTNGYYLKSNGSGAPTWASISIPSAGTSASAVGTSASGGSASTYSKSDHVHNITSSTITSALGYTPYNSTNPSGYVTTDINLQTTTYAPTTDSRTNECPLIFNAANTVAATGTKQSYTAVRYICVSGTKTASRISLGTPDTSGTADKYGAVRLYGTSSGYTDIVGSNNTSTTSYSVNIGNANGKLPVIKNELLTPSSGWTWRVWDSGLQEAWYHGSITFTTAGASYQGWYRSVETISLPTGSGLTAFADSATVIGNGAYNAHIFTAAGLVKTNGTQIEVQLLGGSAVPANTTATQCNIYVCGFARS